MLRRAGLFVLSPILTFCGHAYARFPCKKIISSREKKKFRETEIFSRLVSDVRCKYRGINCVTVYQRMLIAWRNKLIYVSMLRESFFSGRTGSERTEATVREMIEEEEDEKSRELLLHNLCK